MGKEEINLSQIADIKLLLPMLEKLSGNPNATINISMNGPFYVNSGDQRQLSSGETMGEPALVIEGGTGDEASVSGFAKIKLTEWEPAPEFLAEIKDILTVMPDPKWDNFIRLFLQVAYRTADYNKAQTARDLGLNDSLLAHLLKRFDVK